MVKLIIGIVAGVVGLVGLYYSPLNSARRERKRDKKTRNDTLADVNRRDGKSVARKLRELLP